MNKFNLTKDTLTLPNGNVKITRASETPLDDMLKIKSVGGGNFHGCIWDFRRDIFPELNNDQNSLVFKFTIKSNKNQTLRLNIDYRDKNDAEVATVEGSDFYLEAGTTKDYTFQLPLSSQADVKKVQIGLYNISNEQVDFTISNVDFEVLEGISSVGDLQLKMRQWAKSNGDGVIKRHSILNDDWLEATLPANKQFQGLMWTFGIDEIKQYVSLKNAATLDMAFDMFGDFSGKVYLQLTSYDADFKRILNETLKIVAVSDQTDHYKVSLPADYVDNTKFVNLNVFRLDANAKDTSLFFSNITCGKMLDSPVDVQNGARLPIVYLTGDVSQMSKDQKVMLQFEFRDHDRVISGYSETKWQGDSSLSYPKKAYKITLYSDKQKENKHKFVPFAGWAADNEFNLKANYNDATFGRNIINSELFANITENRHGLRTELAKTDTYATVKGCPVLVYINGDFNGIYTFNTTKGLYANMDKTNDNHIVVSGAQWNDIVTFHADEALLDGSDFEIIENSGDNDDTRTKFNRLMKFVNSSTDADFKSHANEYLDIPSMIDWMAFVMMIQGEDSLGKNATFATWDGKIWSATAYDLDTSWSMFYDGTKLVDPSQDLFDFHDNKLCQRIFAAFKDEFKTRYAELRNTVMTPANILDKFVAWYYAIGEENYEAEQKRWNAPSFGVTSLAQLKSDIPLRLLAVDKQVAAK